jgi:hypothetical protein
MAAKSWSSCRDCAGALIIAWITATLLTGWCGNRVAFANHRDCEHLFPSSQFRRVYDLLKSVAQRRCNHRYLEILELAAKEGVARVEDAQRLLLQTDAGNRRSSTASPFGSSSIVCEQAPAITDVHIAAVSLVSFDQLFSQPGALQ